MTFSNLFCAFSDMTNEDRFTVAIMGESLDCREYENIDAIPYDLLNRTVNSFSSWETGVPGHWLVVLR